jgi:hypothetical protein
MSGLFRRNRSTRETAAEETGAEPAVSESDAAGVPARQEEEGGHPPVAEHIRDVPAGVDPDEILDDRPTSRRRSQLRKRARLLHKIRELLLRDLGGLVHEIHRMAEISGDRSRHETLVQAKLERLDRVEHELHELHAILEKPQGPVVLREPGIGGTCPGCGELHGSDARFCWNCGMPLTRGAERRLRAMEAHAEPQEHAGRRRLFGRRRKGGEAVEDGTAGDHKEAAGTDGAQDASPADDAAARQDPAAADAAEGREDAAPTDPPPGDDGGLAPDQQPTVAAEPVRSGDRRA